jgi:hypothetical protein
MTMLIVGFLLGQLVGSLAHEADMRRCIRRYGHTRYSGWLGAIRGKIEEEK